MALNKLKCPTMAKVLKRLTLKDSVSVLGAPLAPTWVRFMSPFGKRTHFCEVHPCECLWHLPVSGPLKTWGFADGLLARGKTKCGAEMTVSGELISSNRLG